MPQFARGSRFPFGIVALARSCATVLTLLLALAAPAHPAGPGQWSNSFSWLKGEDPDHMVAIHMALLPGDGNWFHSRVIWFGGEKNGVFYGRQWGWTPGGEDCSAYPADNLDEILVPTSGLDLFCASQTLIGNKLAVIGGTSPITGSFGERKIRIFTPGAGTETGSWSAPADMTWWRWYPTAVPLRDGRVLTLAGSMHRSHRMFGGYRNGSVPSSPTAHLVQRQQPLPDGGWQTPVWPLAENNLRPDPRYGHTMVDCNGDLGFIGDVLFGGRDSAHTARNDVWILRDDPNYLEADPSYAWVPAVITGGPPPERSDHTMIRTPEAGHQLVVFGGLDDDENPKNDVWRLYVSGGQLAWKRMTITGSPPARYGHAAIYDETQVGTELRKRIIVFGGATGYNADPTDQRVWELRFDPTDPSVATWHEMAVVSVGGSPLPAPRMWHTLTPDDELHSTTGISNAHVALMYGGKLGANSYSSELWGLWMKDDGTVGWQLRDAGTSTDSPGPRARHSAVFDTKAEHANFGRFYVYGGENASGPADSYLYTIDTWNADSPPQNGWLRWADRGFTLSGHSATLRLSELEAARIPEVFDPSVATGDPWTHLSSAPMYQYSYPPAFMVPGAGGGDSRVVNLNTASMRAYYLDIPPTGQPATEWQEWPGGALSFQPLTGVQYRPGRLLIAGGAANGAVTGETATLNTASFSNGWQTLSSMEPRWHHNLVMLPTGQVLAVGGNKEYSDGSAIPEYRPQIWTPDGSGGGSWTGVSALAVQPTARTYHSTAILLPDGRVLSAGGDNTPDKHYANLYCPPYLFDTNGAPITSRPEIVGAPAEVTWGTAFSVCVDNEAPIQSACLIAPGATTHSVDMNQRFIPLTILAKKSSPARLHLTTPTASDAAPPGYYLLFVLGTSQGADVPSIARWVKVSSSTTPAPDELSITADLITCDAIGPLRWSAPSDGGCAARALDYEVRYSFSPINSGNFGSATPLSAVPDPATGGTSQLAGSVTGLSPGTLVYFAGRTRSSAGNWAPLAYAEMASLFSCDGGGAGLSARRTRDEGGPGDTATAPGEATLRPTGSGPTSGLRGRAEANTLVGTSTTRLVGEFSAGSPARWRLHYVDLVGDDARLSASVRHLVVDEPAAGGGWELRDETLAPAGLAGVRDLPGSARLIFPDGTVLEALESRPRSFAIEAAHHSELGELATADTGPVPLDLAPGDTLDLSFRRLTENGAGEDCVFLVRLPGGSLAASARRPGGRPGGDTPPSSAPQAEPLPAAVALHAARPNPFNGETTLRFDLPAAVRVRIELFDVQGRRVAELLDQPMPAGRHAATWSGQLDGGGRAEAGVYLCRMTAGEFVTERRVTRLP